MLLTLFHKESTFELGLMMNVVHSDCSGLVVQDARIGAPAGEGTKATEVASHGVGRGHSVLGTPDKVNKKRMLLV